MDYRRVTEIYDSQRDHGGTGYLIRPNLILTAHHVVAPLGQAGTIGTTYDVRIIGDYEAGQTEWLRNGCQLCWDAPNEKVDLALLRLNRQFISENVDNAPVKYARMVVDEIFAEGYGFPKVQVIENRQNPEPLKGSLNRVAGIKEGQLRLHVTSLVPDKPSDWDGISGTALFAEDYLVGVVVETNKGHAEKALWVVPISIAMDDPEFRELVCYGQTDYIDLVVDSKISKTSSYDILAPPPPPHYLKREKLCNNLKEKILYSQSNTVDVTSSTKIGVHGMGGIGKTVLTSLVVSDLKKQNVFRNGIYWITLGQSPKIVNRQVQLANAISGENEHFTDIQDGQARLRTLLSDRQAMVVLDDAWQMDHIAAFNVLTKGSVLLITTRNTELITGVGGIKFDLDLFTNEQARKLLSRWANKPQLPSQAQEIIEECGNLPLAISMVGGMLRDKDTEQEWQDILELLQDAEISEIEQAFPEYEHPSLFRTMHVSVEALDRDVLDCYLDFAVFAEDTSIPTAVLHTFWANRGFKKSKSNVIISKLVNRSLLKKDQNLLSMHDLQRDYLHTQIGKELPLRHKQLLECYAEKIPEIFREGSDSMTPWWQLSDDGYYYQNLCYHMKEGEQTESLKQLLLTYAWLQTKLDVCGVNALIADYHYGPEDKELSLIQSALSLSSNQITHDTKQLAPHLIGRLKDINSKRIQKLLCEVYESQKEPWFYPLCCSLTPPGGHLIRTLEGHSDWVKAVTISQDGKIALSGSFDHSLKVWDLVGVKALHTLKGHGSPVTSVAISQDGKIGLSGSSDHTLMVWDLVSGKGLRTLKGHSYWVTSVAISPDGKTALSGSSDHTLKLWDLASGKVLRLLEGHSDGVTAVSVSPDGKTALSGSSDHTLKLWDLDSGKVLRTFEDHSNDVTSVAISQDGNIAVSGSGDKTIKVWDLIRGKVLFTLEGHSDRVTAVAIDPDGKTAISGSEDRTLKLWDLRSSQALNTLKGYSSAVTAVAISQDGKTAVSGLYDCTLRLWDLFSGKELCTLEGHSDGVTAVEINTDCITALSGSGDKTLIVWDLVSGKALRILEGHSDWVTAVSISPDGRTAVSSSYDSNLIVWDLGSGKVLHTLVAHSKGVTAVAISPDGKTAISGSEDQTLKLWDLGSGKELHTLEGHNSAVTAVSISPDGKTAISGSYDSILIVWDLVSCQALHTLEGHSRGVSAVAINPDGKTAVSGSNDHTLKLWDLDSGKVLSSFIGESNIKCLSISSCGKIVVAGERSGHVHCLRLEGLE